MGCGGRLWSSCLFGGLIMTFEEANRSIFVEDKETHKKAIEAFGLKYSDGLCFKCDHQINCKIYDENVSTCNFFKRENK